MARERILPSSDTSSNKKAKDAAGTQDHNEKPAIEKDDTPHKTASLAGDERLKHDEHEKSSSSEAKDTRTFQQLVQDYGDDMLSLNELFHAQPSKGDVEEKNETGDGK